MVSFSPNKGSDRGRAGRNHARRDSARATTASRCAASRAAGRSTAATARACRPSLPRTSIPGCGSCMSASRRARFRRANLPPASFAEFGLDPPASVVVLETAGGAVATVNFGVLNPAGTSHYVRLGGAPTVYLMPRHVGDRVAIGGRHGAPAAGAGRARGRKPRHEPAVAGVDGAGVGGRDRVRRQAHPLRTRRRRNWFRHIGQHSHAAGADAHVADPAQARIIDAALGAFDPTAVETPRRACRCRAQLDAIWPGIAAVDRAALCARQLDRRWRGSNSAPPPTVSIAMPGSRRMAMS